MLGNGPGKFFRPFFFDPYNDPDFEIMPSFPRWSREKKKTFLDVLRRTGNASSAARAAGVDLTKAYTKRSKDKTFAAEWQAAIEGSLDDLEEEIRRRALEGTEKPVYYAGKECGSVTSFNDNLAMFLLKAKRPEVFSDAQSGAKDGILDLSKPRKKLLNKLQDMQAAKEGSDKS